MKKHKDAYSAFVTYTVSGYRNNLTVPATKTFYFFAESFGEAAEKAFETFEAYRICDTAPDGDYYGLNYDIVEVGIGKTKL